MVRLWPTTNPSNDNATNKAILERRKTTEKPNTVNIIKFRVPETGMVQGKLLTQNKNLDTACID